VRLACALLLALPLVSTPVLAQTDGCPLVDRTAAADLGFVHQRFASPDRHEPEIMGTGLAWLDFDGDGWTDLYVAHNGPFPPPVDLEDAVEGAANRLWRNRGDGTFEDWTERAGDAGHRGFGQGVTAADFDGDGDPDLYLSNYGPDALLENRGDGTFRDVTAQVGLGLGGWSSAAAFADGDGDGDLDLYVTRYLDYAADHGLFCGDAETGRRTYCDPSLFLGTPDRYYVNQLAETGRATFVDGTEAAGLAGADGRGMGVLFGDLDDDGAPDLYVSNDLTVNLLYRNRGDGTFEDLSLLSGTAVDREGKPEAGMGLAAADFDGDGDEDLAVTNFDVETNTLYRNLGGLLFEDASAASGFGVPSFNLVGFGLVPGDFDGDGALDLYVANGHIFEQPKRPDVTFEQADLLLLGDGRGRFRQAACPVLEASAAVSRGLASADVDRDGAPELGVLNNGGPFQLLSAEAPERWVALELAAPGGNREAVGARVTLVGKDGSRRHAPRVRSGDSYQSSSEKLTTFALPEGFEARALEVLWPSGEVDRLVWSDAFAGRFLRLSRPAGASATAASAGPASPP
jgi:hypothetical protein